MSLMRLLTSGKCLIGLENVESRYRMRNRHLLPKFGKTQNPFAAPAPAQAPATAPRLSPAEVAAANLKETTRLPDAPVAPEELTPTQKKSPVITRLLTSLGRMAIKLIPTRRPKAPKPAIPRFNQPPVQGELSLDNIKVVRNDLSDADVEIVTARPAATRPAAKAATRSVLQTNEMELAESQSV